MARATTGTMVKALASTTVMARAMSIGTAIGLDITYAMASMPQNST